MAIHDKLLYYIFGRENPRAVRAEGYYYFDEHGADYLDATAGAYNCVLGHTMPERIAHALREQPGRLAFASMAYFQNAAANTLADRLLDIFPEYAATGLYQSGADALEAALRCALQVARTRTSPARTKLIGRRNAYHGLTLGAMALGGSGGVRAEDVPNFRQLEQQDCFNCPLSLTYPSCNVSCASALEKLIQREGPETVAAFVGVPSTNGGPVPDEYWPRIRQICDEYGVLLVADEVLEGMWRIGPALALQKWGVTPDIVATGKPLGAGFVPIFATLVTSEIRDTLAATGRFWGGHTYSGHAFSCEIALAVLDELQAKVVNSDAISRIEAGMSAVFTAIRAQSPRARTSVIGAMGRLILPCQTPRDVDSFYLDVQRLLKSCGLLIWIEDIQPTQLELGLGPPFIADEHFFAVLQDRLSVFVGKLATLCDARQSGGTP